MTLRLVAHMLCIFENFCSIVFPSPNFTCSATLLASYTALQAAFLARRYSFLLPPFCQHFQAARFFLTAAATVSFHHHVTLCLSGPFVQSQTVSANSNKSASSDFHMLLTPPLLSILEDLSLKWDTTSFLIEVACNLHTFFFRTKISL